MHPVRSILRNRFNRGHSGRISRAQKASGVVTTTLALLFASSLAADAKVSITNRDTKDHKITIVIEGQGNQDQVLKPEQVVEQVCDKGCILRLNDSEDDEYQLEMNDIVSIEDGYLYYDNDPSADAPAAKPDDAKQDPAAPPKGEKKG